MITFRGSAAICAGLALVLLATPPALADDRPTLRPGSTGAWVAQVQKRLKKLRFHPTAVNARYGRDTRMAVWAFQKAQRLRPRNAVNAATWTALRKPRKIRPLIRHGERKRIEIDLSRQLLTLYAKGKPALISHISTGTRTRYCDRGHCGVAITPKGDFRIFRKTKGWSKSPLGWMYKPMFFHGGIAIHGSSRVPLRRASHGCVRVPLNLSRTFFRKVEIGTPVYVRR